MYKITITDSSTKSITEEMGRDIVLYSASSVSLTSDISVVYGDTPYEGLSLNIYAMCSFGTSAGVRNVTILGQAYQHIQFTAQNSMSMTAIYLNSAWKVYSNSSNIVNTTFSKLEDVEDLSVATGVITLIDRKNRQRFNIYGSTTLTGEMEIKYHASTAPRVGEYYEFTYNGTVTYSGGGNIKILGRNLTAAEALSGELFITALYTTASGWSVKVLSESYIAPAIDGVLDFDITIADADVKKLNGTPVSIITGDDGKIIDILSIYAQKVGTLVYASSTNPLTVYCNGSLESLYTNIKVFGLGADEIQGFSTEAVGDTETVVVGQNMMMNVPIADPTGGGTGNGLRIFGTYRLIS